MAEAEMQQAASVETKAETKKTPSEFARHWLQAIDLAGKEEQDWRKDASETIERYRKTKAKSFNILYANTETTCPALYNSEPVPDIRRRFGDEDPVGKAGADMLERLLSIQCELYDFDGVMKAAVKDRQLAGRGVTRVRVNVGAQGSKWVSCEQVVWDDFRRGPAKLWRDVPWVAFRHRMTREELIGLDPIIGKRVNLDAVVDKAADGKDAENLPDMFKRALVWEVWDKTERKVYFFAESYPDGALKVLDEDPYKLREFFPIPRPLYQIEQPDSLVPSCEFMLWKPLADELDSLTARIAGVVKVMKLRGLYAGQFEALVTKLGQAEDGDLVPAEDSARAMTEGGIDKAVWMWPVDMAIKVVEGLYKARMEAKASVYEMTGVADILRGQTDPNETLGAQQIKAQWGSLRLQDAQKDVQRYARDLFRMMADLSCQELEFAAITAITGISFMPKEAPQDPAAAQQAMMQAQQMAQAVEKLLKGPDLAREFAIDIETDSTIRADLSRAQQNISGFITGLGEFMTSVGPAVQAQMMPPEIAVKFVGAFARNFKLGRDAETLTDEWVKWLEQKAQQPPQPSPEQQAAQIEMQQSQQKQQAEMQKMQAEAQAKAAERQQELQFKQQEHAMKLQAQQAELDLKAKELALKEQELGLKMQAAQQSHAFNMQAMQEEAEARRQGAAKDAEFEDQRRASELEHLKQRQAMKPQGAMQ